MLRGHLCQLLPLVVALSQLAGSSSVWAAGDGRLSFCVESPQRERHAARALARWVTSLRLVLVPRSRCHAQRGGFRAWFERRRGQTALVLEAQGGQRSRRRMPWLTRRPRLSVLARRGHLPRLAVIMHGLVIGARLGWLIEERPSRRRKGAATRRSRKRGTPTRVRAKRGLLAATLTSMTEVARVSRPKLVPTKKQPAVVPTKKQPAVASTKRQPVVAPTRSTKRRPKVGLGLGQVSWTPHGAEQKRADANGVVGVSAPRVAPLAAASTPSNKGADEPGLLATPAAKSPVVRSSVVRSPVVRVSVVRAPAAADPSTRANTVAVAPARSEKGETQGALRTRSSPAAAGSALRRFGVEASFGGRWRSGGVQGLEIGGRLLWLGGLYFSGAYQPESEWDLGGRPIGVSAVPMSLGWRSIVWRGRSFEVCAQFSLLVEHLMLRRLDQPQGDRRTHWDLGGGVGFAVSQRLPLGFGVGAFAHGAWFPASPEISIDGGPSAKLSSFGVRWGFFLDWRTP